MPMRSKVLLELKHSFDMMEEARQMAETAPGQEAEAALRDAERNFRSAAEGLAQMVPGIIPPQERSIVSESL